MNNTNGNKQVKRMRTNLIFDTLHTLQNRYMLCQLASKATRKFHRPNTRIQETMNDVLGRIARSKPQEVVGESAVPIAEAQRRAA
jgi:hypothetical protein